MRKFWLILVVCLLLVPSCGKPVEPSADTSVTEKIIHTDEVAAITFESSATKTPIATPSVTTTQTQTQIPATQTLTPTITPTSAPLKSFSSSELASWVTVSTYLPDVCSYLENRWGEGKSEPGTIVVPIMFHSIAKLGREIEDYSTISMEYFKYFMPAAKEMGFETITTAELTGFLESNEKIPQRSMLLILDDRRPGVTELFMPYLEENNWTLTLAWPTTDETRDDLWEQMETLAESGHLDVQSHGHDHIYIQGYTPVEEIREEVYQPIEVIREHFGTTPTALIWPGGNFNEIAVAFAREAGFKLGFTVYSRGPLMFNWIPLGEPELAMGDPLMVLPRYWSTAADVALMQAIKISEAAIAEAEVMKEAELLYYARYCQPQEGE